MAEIAAQVRKMQAHHIQSQGTFAKARETLERDEDQPKSPATVDSDGAQGQDGSETESKDERQSLLGYLYDGARNMVTKVVTKPDDVPPRR